jgi:hypothetical protein
MAYSTIQYNLLCVCVCRHELLDELRILLVHGMLHLCGLDHERSDKVGATVPVRAGVACPHVLQGMFRLLNCIRLDLISAELHEDKTETTRHSPQTFQNVHTHTSTHTHTHTHVCKQTQAQTYTHRIWWPWPQQSRPSWVSWAGRGKA